MPIDAGGGKRLPVYVPKPRKRAAPPPRSDVQSGGGYNFPKPRRVVDKATFTRPIGPAPLTVPRSVPKRQRLLYGPDPLTAARLERQRAQNARRRQIVAKARQDVVLGPSARLMGPPSPGYKGIGPQPTARTVRRRYSGIGPPTPAVTPDVQHAIRTLLKPGARGKTGAIITLKRQGIVNPYGTTTHQEATAQRVAYRRALIEAAVQKQVRLFPHADMSTRELRWALHRKPTGELERIAKYQPSETQILTSGINPETIGGLIHAGQQGIGVLATAGGEAANRLAGLNKGALPGRFLSDVANWPTWAVPAAYEAATHPERFVKGLSQGVIGNLARGDTKAAREVFRQHPLFALAELRGAAALGGRLAAAPIRAASGGRVLGTGREPINLTGVTGSPTVQLRSGTKALALPRLRQKAVDALLTRPGAPVRVAGRGTVAARELRTELPVVGRALEGQRRHLVERMTDVNRSTGITHERLLREQGQSIAHSAIPETKISQVLHRALGLPIRPSTAEGYHGALGKIAARVAPGLALNPVQDLASFAIRGVIRHEVRDEHGTLLGPATAHSVAEDIDHIITQTKRSLATPGAYRNLHEIDQAQKMVAFLSEVRNSGRGLTQVVRIARAVVPELQRSTSELERLGALSKDAGERAPLFPFALSSGKGIYSNALKQDVHGGAITARQELRSTRHAVGKQIADLKQRERYLMGLLAGTVKETDRVVAAGRVVRYGPHFRADAVRAELADVRRRLGETRIHGKAGIADARDRVAQAQRLEQGTRSAQLHTPEGLPLSNEDIRAAMRAHGVDPALVAHLPHSELGRGAYHKQQTTEGRRNADSHALTGKMWERGSAPYTWQHVTDSIVHARTLGANVQTLDTFVHDLGTRIGEGTWDETVRFAESHRNKDGSQKYIAVRRVGAKLDADRREQITGLQDVTPADQPLAVSMLDERLRPPDKDGPDVAVVVPAEAVARAKEHIKGGATIASMQALSSAFRQTVLPFSTKWLTGNVAEAILRTVAVTANPLDRRTARVALDRMIAEDALQLHAGNPAVTAKARALVNLTHGAQRALHPGTVRALRKELIDYAPRARAAEAELTGGLLYGARGQSVRRTAQEMGPVGQTVGAIGKLPVVNEFVGMTRWLAHRSFAINRVLEREAQYTALGKHVRNEIQEFTGQWQSGIRLHEQGIQDFSKGLLGTPRQVKAANWLDETLGRYSRFSPDTRRIIQTYAPFLPWYLNAVRWTMLTIPGKHPVKFALWLSAERTFQQDWEDQHTDKLTRHGDLATAIARKDGGFVPAARYTPFGLLGPVLGGKDPQAIPGLLMPQFSGVYNALLGRDPFGNDLIIPKKYGGTGEKLEGSALWKVALNQGAESIVPLLQIARRVREKGETGLPTSTVLSPKTKTGSAHGGRSVGAALGRIFNPVNPVYLRPPQGASGLPAEVQAILKQSQQSGGLPPEVQAILQAAGG